MVTRTYSSTIQGVEAQLISIEVSIINGTKFFIVGLPDSAIKESEQRIESVLKHANRYMPRQRVIVNLAPASLRKEGAAYDLPVALAILKASGQEALPDLSSYLIAGELALDGKLRPIRGALSMAMLAAARGVKGFILPQQNAAEAAVVEGVRVIPAGHIMEVLDFLNGRRSIEPAAAGIAALSGAAVDSFSGDMQEVRGQVAARRCAEVAAAGGHNLFMIGSPGGGKTMLAKRIPSILPPMQLKEALETSKVYSAVGKLPEGTGLLMQRPFRAPHHTISDVALVGGGPAPRPGEVSLAHNGVLFLDELAEFKRQTLEALRQPSETRTITVTRARLSVDFPANFMLVASMNPCPCGYYTHPTRACTCTPPLRRKYVGRVSGPLLDRIDIQLEIQPVGTSCFTEEGHGEPSALLQARVTQARRVQAERLAPYPHLHNNAMLPSKLVEEFCKLSPDAQRLLTLAMEKLGLSARAYDSIRKVSRTIADLEGVEEIKAAHVGEAIQYRSLDRSGWGN